MSRFNLSALAVRERSVTLFVILLISIAGVLAFFKLGRAEDPAFTVKTMTVTVAPSAASESGPSKTYFAWKVRVSGSAALDSSRRRVETAPPARP